MTETLFETYKAELISLIQSKHIDNRVIETPLPSLHFHVIDTPAEFAAVAYEPSVCIVLQGGKEVILGETIYALNDPSKYLLVSVHVTTRVRIKEASKEKPYIAIKLTFTMEDIYEVMKEIKTPTPILNPSTEAGLCYGDLHRLIDPLTRLVRVLDEPSNLKFISSMIIKEILYLIMTDEGGDFLRKYLKDGSITHQIVKIISKIKRNFSENINMKELAKSFGMSESSLYHNFKKVTLLSPLQFQKTLRLQEARHIILTQDIDVGEVAFSVGYESPSQFSREYSRMFGLSPKAHMKLVQ
ncbi:MAG: HTH-type transcriptional activator RhaS [Proteobacteria bacterium]|nr:HTH-type transcriptional activator RhaS [Pseudomonadota bacterium]